MRHAFNMTRGTSNDRSLIDTDGKLTAPQNLVWLLPTFSSGLQLSINTWLILGYQAFHGYHHKNSTKIIVAGISPQ
jgi:hypothetical protein